MEHYPWTLEFGDSGVKLFSPYGLLAVLSYPFSESAYSRRPASVNAPVSWPCRPHSLPSWNRFFQPLRIIK